MRNCRDCDYENEDGSRYCESCGASLGEATEPVEVSRPCPACRDRQPVSNRFCTRCGERMASTELDKTDPSPSCPACGTPLLARDRFCSRCGHCFEAIPVSVSGASSREEESTGYSSQEARLVVLAGREKDRVFTFGSTGIRLGREKDNEVAMETDAYVSPLHARVYAREGAFWVEDSGSVNGTFLKLRRQTKLEPGDELKVGQTLLRFDPGSEE